MCIRDRLAPDTFSLANYREAETVVADWQALARKAGEIAARLPASSRDAFHQLIGFPVKATSLVNELYFTAGRNQVYSQQGRASANLHASRVNDLFAEFMNLTDHYNGPFANGRWAHFMDQPVLGYTSW